MLTVGDCAVETEMRALGDGEQSEDNGQKAKDQLLFLPWSPRFSEELHTCHTLKPSLWFPVARWVLEL